MIRLENCKIFCKCGKHLCKLQLKISYYLCKKVILKIVYFDCYLVDAGEEGGGPLDSHGHSGVDAGSEGDVDQGHQHRDTAQYGHILIK